MLLTAKMLQGKIKWTESPEKYLHKNDVELYFFQIFLWMVGKAMQPL